MASRPRNPTDAQPAAPSPTFSGPVPVGLATTVDAWFRGKSVFVTGFTGFVGKVLCEKILRSLPHVGTIYLLIRPKKGASMTERVRQSFDSACFDTLRLSLGEAEFLRLIDSKVVGVEGDLMQEKLGIADHEYEDLSGKVNAIVHLAATLDFNEAIDLSVRMNVLGSMRVMSFARRCVQRQGSAFGAFVHISTCYVNFPRHSAPGPVLELLYPLPFDHKAVCRRILDMDEEEVQKDGPRILRQYGYPNTYTFTKSIAEHILMELRADVPLCILRPAIIGAALKEPMPGWTDTLSAAGGIFLGAGMGICQEMHCHGGMVADVVPVDFVVNATLRAVVKTAETFRPYLAALTSAGVLGPGTGGGGEEDPRIRANLPALPLAKVYQCGTSGGPARTSWNHLASLVVTYWKRYPVVKSPPNPPPACRLIDNVVYQQARFRLLRQLPLELVAQYSKLPGVANEKKEKEIARMRKGLARSQLLNETFEPFMTHQWVFDHTHLQQLLDGATDEDRGTFGWDMEAISWRSYVGNYCYGMVKYILKQQPAGKAITPDANGSSAFLRAML